MFASNYDIISSKQLSQENNNKELCRFHITHDKENLIKGSEKALNLGEIENERNLGRFE